MVSCVQLSSSEPAEMATMLRPAAGDVIVTERGVLKACSIRLDFACLWMQHVEETLPRIWESGASVTRAAIWFLTQPGRAVAFQGTEVREQDIGICPVQQPMWQRLTGPAHWGSMSIPLKDWDALSTVTESDLFSSLSGMVVTPQATDLLRLQRLHRSTARLAVDTPEMFENPEVARGIEQSLIDAMTDCLPPSAMGRTDIPLRRRAGIMKRFRQVLDDCVDAPLYMPELCVRLNVASRTLRTVCHEYLGMGPKKYLHVRRMHLVRRALRVGTPDTTTVTDTAMRYGFWELGRFAIEYRALFGESPSVTLRSGS